MPRARSELKVAASDALEFEAIQSKPPRSRRGFSYFIFGSVFVVLISSGWLLFGDMVFSLTSDRINTMPLIAAPAEQVKVRPKKPGGLQVPNRDKLVYERIQSGTATSSAGLVERLLPETEKPLPIPVSRSPELSNPRIESVDPSNKIMPEDLPSYSEAKVPTVAEVVSVKPPPLLSITPETKSSERSTANNFNRKPLRLTKQMVPDKQPIPVQKKAAQAGPSLSEQSPPQKKPNVLSLSKPEMAALVSKRELPKVQSLPSAGSFRVQLAAARTPERVRSEWDRLRRKHLDLLGNLGLTVMKVDLGPKKGVFYRLRVGPLSDELSARALCKELSERKTGCLIIKPIR